MTNHVDVIEDFVQLTRSSVRVQLLPCFEHVWWVNLSNSAIRRYRGDYRLDYDPLRMYRMRVSDGLVVKIDPHSDQTGKIDDIRVLDSLPDARPMRLQQVFVGD